MFSVLHKSWSLLLFLLFASSISSQQQEFILGRLLDAQTKEPIVFASIRIKDRALGIISNVDGSFKIPMKYKEYGDIIEISSMGYQSKEVLINELSENKINVLELHPGVLELTEAVVKAKRNKRLSARKIVKKAIAAIPKNYPTNSFSTIGYYRDYQYKDGNYINLNEAILEIFDQGFDQYDQKTSEIRIFEYAMNEEFQQDTLSRAQYDYKTNKKVIDKAYLEAYGGNELTILRIHDAIRNYNLGSYDFVGNLETDFMENHSFSKSDDTYLDNKVLYAITCNTIRNGYRAQGTLYISKSDFAIHKMEYTLYDNRSQKKEKVNNKHGHKKKTIFEVVVDYAKLKDKLYLNYISFYNNFQLNLPPKFVVDEIAVLLEERCFLLKFNNSIDFLSAQVPKNYRFNFKGEKLNFEKIEVFKDSIKLFPKLKQGPLNDMMREINIANRKRNLSKELLNAEIKNLKDIEGNIINEWEIEDYQQFREFFVQRVNHDSRAPFDNLFMNKRKPIFEEQPIAKPKDFHDYWKNTPLPTLHN